ncbi:MAG: 1-acyl-sn-glycerol-3-phosphate acyltransferase [Planctomycetes bacterium]|nr:1-acyl-sn-glycerol-3-phosphate acyltransferase [Planctomycetota bacterium]
MSGETTRPLEREAWDARAGSRLRGFVMVPFVALWAFVWAGMIALRAVLFPKTSRASLAFMVRTWGRVQLRLLGIELVESGTEWLDEDKGSRIVLFNHQSLLDLAVLSAEWRPGTRVIYKQEFHKIPGVGHALRSLGMIPVDRSNRERAIRTLREAAERVRQEGTSILVAPEGTRSKTSGLLAFKRGPFHVALETKAPLVPMLMLGLRDILPHDKIVPRTGRIGVIALPPIDTSDWTPMNIEQRMAAVRELFLQYIPPSPGTEPSAPASTPASASASGSASGSTSGSESEAEAARSASASDGD